MSRLATFKTPKVNEMKMNRDLENTRNLNREIKKANQRAGARYAEEDTGFDPHSPWGMGANQTRLDMPTSDHEYRGMLLQRDKKEPSHWYVDLDGVDSAPDLKGMWSDLPSLEKAVDAYLAQHPTLTLQGHKG